MYEQLGYYFLTFRALDETYFRYSEVSSASSSSAAASSSSLLHRTLSGSSGGKPTRQGTPDEKASLANGESADIVEKGESVVLPSKETKSEHGIFDAAHHEGGLAAKRRGKVEIVEGPKEGVEGVGVGAVNVYMVVFGDGIISVSQVVQHWHSPRIEQWHTQFHFEDIDKHVNRVRNRIQQYGIAKSISSREYRSSFCCDTLIIRHSDWIAYGMMDSIVDTFFPLIDFIETESDDIDSFLANPLSAPRQAGQPSSTESNRARRSVKKPSRLYALKIRFPSVVKTPSLMQFYGSVRSVAVSSDREASFSSFGRTNKHDHDYVSALAPRTMGKKALRGVEDKLFERSKMLKRIAESRKLIQGLSRLLTPKTDVVRGLRKRIKEESISLGYAEPGQRHDIGIYLGDLQGELAPSLNNMQAQIALTTAQIIF